MRMLAYLFTVIMTTTISTAGLASIASSANVAQQTNQATQSTTDNANQPDLPMPLQLQAINQHPADQPEQQVVNPQAIQAVKRPPAASASQPAQAVNASTEAESEKALLPGSQVLVGNPNDNEFFIVGENQPTPPALIQSRKRAEERVKPVQVAIDEAKKIQDLQAPKLEQVLKTKAQSPLTKTVLKQPLQAENDVPQLGNMLTPVVSDAATAPLPSPAPSERAAKPKVTTTSDKAEKKSEKPQAVKPIKHVFNAVSTPKHVAVKKVKQNASTTIAIKQQKKSVNVKALLAKVEVVKPDLKKNAKHQATKTITSTVKSAKAKTANAKTPHKALTLGKAERVIKYGAATFKVKPVSVD